MKIALCTSGHLRCYKTFKSSYDKFYNLLSNNGANEIDVFACIWNRREAVSSWAEHHGLVNTNNRDEIITKEHVEEFYKTKNTQIFDDYWYSSEYSPLNLKCLTQSEFDGDLKYIHNNILHYVKMHFLIHECQKMRKQAEFTNNKKYDVVFKIRPELVYDMPSVQAVDMFKIIKEQPDDNYVVGFCPGGSPFGPVMEDRMHFGGSAGMDKYAATYLSFNRLFSNNVFIDGETSLYLTLMNMNCRLVFLPCRIAGCGSDVSMFIR
jgi:hypothetical protein